MVIVIIALTLISTLMYVKVKIKVTVSRYNRVKNYIDFQIPVQFPDNRKLCQI